jgi:hypothetical protein
LGASASIVEAGDQIAVIRQCAMKQSAVSVPRVHDGDRRRFSINMHQQRIFLGRIEDTRLQQPSVQGRAVGE